MLRNSKFWFRTNLGGYNVNFPFVYRHLRWQNAGLQYPGSVISIPLAAANTDKYEKRKTNSVCNEMEMICVHVCVRGWRIILQQVAEWFERKREQKQDPVVYQSIYIYEEAAFRNICDVASVFNTSYTELISLCKLANWFRVPNMTCSPNVWAYVYLSRPRVSVHNTKLPPYSSL